MNIRCYERMEGKEKRKKKNVKGECHSNGNGNGNGKRRIKYLQPGADNFVDPIKSTIYSQAILDNASDSRIYPARSLVRVPGASFSDESRTLWMAIVDSDLPLPIDDDQ